MHDEFGSRQGNRHAPPDLSLDIDELMKSLREHRVYIQEAGRVIEGDKAVAPDVIAKGAEQMLDSLTEYNALFQRLRERRRLRPLVGDPPTFPVQPSNIAVVVRHDDTATVHENPASGQPGGSSATVNGHTDPTASTEPSGGAIASDDGAWRVEAEYLLDSMSITSSEFSGSASEAGSEDAHGAGTSGTGATDVPDYEESSASSDGGNRESEDNEEEYTFQLDLDPEPVFSLETEADVDFYMY